MSDKIYRTYRGKAYRFMSFEGLFATIQNRSLRFSRADQFNDPLDNSPLLMNLDWEGISLNSPGFIKIATAIGRGRLFSSIYLCCFSKTYTSPKSYLMWSHYALSHTQVCFELDFSKHNYCGSPSEVTYPNDLAAERDRVKTGKGEIGMFVVTNKSKVWKYEEEVRLIYDTQHRLASKGVEIIDNGKKIEVTFDPKMISKVIFGFKSSEHERLKTLALFKDIGHMPIFEEMTINPLKLELGPIEYRPPTELNREGLK